MAGDQAPSPNGEPPSRVDELLDELRERVARRRAAGEYPPELEQRLSSHYELVRQHRSQPNPLEGLRRAVEQSRPDFSAAHITTASRVPAGERYHQFVAKAIDRQVTGILLQMQYYADRLQGILELIVERLEDPQSHEHPELDHRLEDQGELLTRLLDPAGPDPWGQLAALRQRVEALEAERAAARFRPWFNTDRFNEAFRGSRDALLKRYRDLAKSFEGCAPVLDIGCGEGEFLELLGELGVEARGVEVDAGLVESDQARGLDVRLADALSALDSEPDEGLGGIVLIQVVEHLGRQELLDVVELAFHKLRAGGRLIMETVNPQSLYVFAHAFYLDPTHTTPIHPSYLQFLCEERGFSTVDIEWRSPPPDADLPPVPEDKQMADAIEAISRQLFGPGDYAVIATK